MLAITSVIASGMQPGGNNLLYLLFRLCINILIHCHGGKLYYLPRYKCGGGEENGGVGEDIDIHFTQRVEHEYVYKSGGC